MAEENRALTVPEVAELLGISKQAVYRRLTSGDLKYQVTQSRSREYKIMSSDVDQYIAAGRPMTPPRPDPTWMRTSEVARLTGFTCDTIRRMCYDGLFQHYRSKGRSSHLRIARASVEEFMRNAASVGTH